MPLKSKISYYEIFYAFAETTSCLRQIFDVPKARSGLSIGIIKAWYEIRDFIAFYDLPSAFVCKLRLLIPIS